MSQIHTIIRKSAVMEKTGYSGYSIDRLEEAGEFPKRVQLGKRAVGWFSHEVDTWIRSRIRGRGRSLPEQHKGGSTADGPQVEQGDTARPIAAQSAE